MWVATIDNLFCGGAGIKQQSSPLQGIRIPICGLVVPLQHGAEAA